MTTEDTRTEAECAFQRASHRQLHRRRSPGQRIMKVETSAELLRIDVLTESHGNSACNLFVADPNTEVYYGGLHARVTFIDLGIEITMNSEPGDWTDAKWVRAHAWKEVCKRVTPSAFAEALAGARSQGRREGAEQAKYDMRKALGVED